jgi:hypothetical protein
LHWSQTLWHQVRCPSLKSLVCRTCRCDASLHFFHIVWGSSGDACLNQLMRVMGGTHCQRQRRQHFALLCSSIQCDGCTFAARHRHVALLRACLFAHTLRVCVLTWAFALMWRMHIACARIIHSTLLITLRDVASTAGPTRGQTRTSKVVGSRSHHRPQRHLRTVSSTERSFVWVATRLWRDEWA